MNIELAISKICDELYARHCITRAPSAFDASYDVVHAPLYAVERTLRATFEKEPMMAQPQATHYRHRENGPWFEWDDPSHSRDYGVLQIRYSDNSVFSVRTGEWSTYSEESNGTPSLTDAIIDSLVKRGHIQRSKDGVLSINVDAAALRSSIDLVVSQIEAKK